MSEFEPVSGEFASHPAHTSGPGLLPWPPPGLERVQGDLWSVTRRLFIGGLLLVLPLLLAIGYRQESIGTGPFGDAWWILIATTLVAIAILLDAFVAAFRLLRRFADGVGQGYDWRLIALVAADHERDSGFLMQGARAYGGVGERGRNALRVARLAAPLLAAAGALWLIVGFSLGVLLASRDALGATGLAWFVLLPAALLAGLGTLIGFWESLALRRLRRTWHADASAGVLAGSDAHAWQTLAEERVDANTPVRGTGRSRGFRIAAVALIVLGLLASLPVWPLVTTAAVGPVLAMIGAPSFSRVQAKLAAAEPLRRYRPAIDRSITPREAGELLHVVASVGTSGPSDPLMRAPARVYADAWYAFTADDPTGFPVEAWPHELLPAYASVDAEGRARIAAVAAHPAHAEFSRLATAGALDAMATRYVELPDTLSLWALPIPRFAQLRNAAYTHIGRAIHELQQGRPADAESTIREVLGVGFLLADDGPTLIENLLGLVLVSIGADALEALYRATGRAEDADELASVRRAALRATERMQVLTPAEDGAGAGLAAIRGMPGIVVDSAALIGLRWESFMHLNTLGPCLNLNRAVFGPDRTDEAWLQEAERSLVRYPSEQQLFRIARSGYFGADGPPGERSGIARLLTFTMGGRGTPGSCARMIDAVAAGF